ncbi:hypothetical protein OG937_29170 [Streptomyces sp. NBC_00510]
MAAAENDDGCTTNPRRTKLMLTQEMDDVTEAMKGARMFGVGIQVRNVVRPGGRPGHYQEWWEIVVFDDVPLSRDDGLHATE